MFFAWLIFAILTAIAARSRGRSFFLWLLFGVIFGVFALILVFIIPSRSRNPDAPNPETHLRCPDCQELVLWDARVCKHCGCRLKPPPRESTATRRNPLLAILKKHQI